MALAYRIDVLWGDVMYTNSDMTLYHYDKSTKTYQRIYIYGVFWDAVKRSNVLKTGQTNSDSLLIFIPARHVTSLDIDVGKDLVVKGICPKNISNSSEETQLRTIKELKTDYPMFTVTTVDPKFYGSPAMQHYELSCK